MSAKSNFISRIKGLHKSLDIEAVMDKDLRNHDHNEIARIIRNGLAVVGFAALEDFIKTRCSEIAKEIGTTGVRFDHLPEKLKDAFTFEALTALAYQLSLKEKAEKISYTQEQSAKIASTINSTYELSDHAL